MIRQSFTIAIGILLALALAPDAGTQGRGQGMGRGQQQRVQRCQVQGGCVGNLQLSMEQQREIARIRQQTQQRVQAARTNPNLTRQQRAERIRQIQREGHDRVIAVLTPQQRQQFQQWWDDRYQGDGRGQGRGPMGADIGQGVPGVQLTAEQRQEVAEIRARARARIQEINRNQNLTQAQRAEQIQEVRQQAHEDVLDVLTPQQRRQFNDWWQRRQPAMQSTPPG